MKRMQDSNKHKQNKDAVAVPTSDTPKQTQDTTGTTESTTSPNTETTPVATAAVVASNDSATPVTETKDTTPAKETVATDTSNNTEHSKEKDGATVPTTTATSSPATESSADVPTGSNRPLAAFIAGVLLVVIGSYVYNYVANPVDEPIRDYPDPIAVVNGEPVDQALFYQNLDETVTALEAQGIDVTDPTVRSEFENQVVDTIINTRLLVSAAQAGGFTPSEEEITERITQLESQYGGEAALNTELERLGLDRDRLNDDVREQLSVDALLGEDVFGDNLTVTDEELQEAYDALAASGRELPELETIRDALTAQIEQQKQQTLIEEYLTELRDAAEIEINL